MNTNAASDTIEALNWRYATKKFDPTAKLSQEELEYLLEATRLSASSFGLQPWKLILVNDPALRTKIRAAAYDQSQITDASNLFVFAVRTDVDERYVDMFIAQVAASRGAKPADLAGYSDSIKGALKMRGPESTKEWSTRQTYIAVGTLLSAAAAVGIDACPMEGFDPAKVDTILGLPAMKLESRVIVTVGARSKDDSYAKLPKFRFPKKDIVVEL